MMNPSFIEKPAEMSKGWKARNPQRMAAEARPTAVAGLFPAALELASRLPGEKERIRFMRLKPGGS